jgi:hypothetical protein
MAQSKHFTFSVEKVHVAGVNAGQFQTQCRSGGGGNGKCRGGKTTP